MKILQNISENLYEDLLNKLKMKTKVRRSSVDLKMIFDEDLPKISNEDLS